MSLFFKECKLIARSIIYFVFIAVMILFYISQLGNYAGVDIKQVQDNAAYSYSNPLMEPPIDAEFYGTKQAEIPEQIMPSAILSLVQEYLANKYTTYPLGFYKNVKLNEKDQLKVANKIEELTNARPEELVNSLEEFAKLRSNAYLSGTEPPKAEEFVSIFVTYDVFKEKMAEIDQILGGGSQYSSEWLLKNGRVPLTYEEKLTNYTAFIREDQITGAYARLFCDYMGIVISLFSIFVPVAFLMRDRRANMNELLYSRKKGSASLVFLRYGAVVFMMLLPFLLLSIIPTVQLVQYGASMDLSVDAFAFLKYILSWLLPTLMTTTAIGFIFTILTDTPIAIAIQLLWGYFFDLMLSFQRMQGGNYGFELVIRHNILGNLQEVKDGMNALVINRSFYVIVSLVLIVISSLIYDQKRRGRLDFGGSLQKIFRPSKSTN